MKPQDEPSAKGAHSHSHFGPCIFPTIFGLVQLVFCISFIFSSNLMVFMAFSAPACSYVGKVPKYF